MEKIDYKKQGKKNRASGLRFESKVRADLIEKGWIVDKWTNNVDFPIKELDKDNCRNIITEGVNFIGGKLVPAKHKFRGPGIPMAMGTGFPDFIAFNIVEDRSECADSLVVGWNGKENEVIQIPSDASVMGVEVKSNGYLKPEEKAKCQWYLDNNIFSKILIAKKGKKRGEIEYVEF